MTKRFPRSESDIATLAVRVVDGLTNAAEDFPAPPVSPEELRGKLDSFKTADTATVAAKTELRNQHEEKDEALDELVDALKADLGYAEIAVRDAPQKLNALGWRPPRDGTRWHAHDVPDWQRRSRTDEDGEVRWPGYRATGIPGGRAPSP